MKKKTLTTIILIVALAMVAAVTQSAAIDLTTGESAAVGAKLTENHLYLVQADGAGIQATADTTVMVRGGYSVG